MDHHRQRHHNNHHHHNYDHEFMDSNTRYFPLRPPPPPPPSFHHPNLYPHPPPPPPQHHPHHHTPYRHLPPPQFPPPPPPQYRPPPPMHPVPPPPQPSLFYHHHHHHHSHHQPVNFVDSPPHHQRHLTVEDDRDPFRPNFEFSHSSRVPPNQGVAYDSQYREDDRHQFYLPEPPRVSPVIALPISTAGLVRDHDTSVEFNRMSSPSFRETQFDGFRHHDLRSPPRFGNDLDEDPGIRLRSDELGDWTEDMRIVDDMERDRLEDHHRFHEQYHPEMLPREFELSSDNVHGSMVDEVMIRESRDGMIMDDDVNINVNVRYDVQPPPRDMSRSPIKFRIRGINRDEGFREFYDEGKNLGSESSGRYYDRGNRREDMQDYRRTLRKNSQKKSAFLRIQPKHGSFRNKHDTTPSPLKVKESLEVIGHRFSDERDGSPVELDVSFKSNSLVAKAIMAVPSCSEVDPNDNTTLNGMETRVDSKSPLKEGNRNFRDNSSNSGKVEKLSEKRIRISPTFKRFSRQSNVDVCGSNSEPPSCGSSSLSGGTTDRGSPKDEISDMDVTNVGLGNASSSSSRKKRKFDILLSRLSSSPSKTDTKLASVISSADHPSTSSDDCMKQTGKESSSSGKVVPSNQDETVADTEKMNVKGSPFVVVQAVGHTVAEAPLQKRVRKKGVLGSCLDSSGPLLPRIPESLVETNRCFENMQTISETEEDLTKSMDKCISDTSTVVGSHESQILVPVLIDNVYGKGYSEPLISTVRNIHDTGILSDDLDKRGTSDVINSISINLDAPIKIQDGVDVSCNVDKPCGTQVMLSPENGMIRSCGEENLYGNDNNKDEAKNNGFLLNSFKVDISSEKTSATCGHDDIVIDSKKLTTVPSLMPTNDIQEQQCGVEGAVLVSGADREGPSKASIYVGGDLSLCPVGQHSSGSVFNRKRKSENNRQYLNSGISEFSHDTDGTKSFLIKNSNLPVRKVGSVVLGLPCCVATLDIPLWKGLEASCPELITSMDHGDNSNAIEYPTHHNKKIRSVPLESVCSDESASQNSDLPAPSDSLTCIAKVSLNSAEYSTQSAEEMKLSYTVLFGGKVVGGATSNLQKTRYGVADGSNADMAHGELCLTVNKNAPLNEMQASYLSCKQEENVTLQTCGTVDGNESVALDSRIRTNYPSGAMNCVQNYHIKDSSHGPLFTNTECANNIAVDDNLPSESDCPQLHAECPDDGATLDDHIGDSDHGPLVTDMESKEPSASCCLQSHAESTDGEATTDFDMVGTVLNAIGTHSLNSNTVPALNLSDGKLGLNAKRTSECSVTQGYLSSQCNSLIKNDETNSKPGVLAAAADQPFAQKRVVSPKNAKITAFRVNPMTQLLGKRNVLIRADTNFSSARASSFTTPSNKALSTYPLKPRTWRRTDNLPASNTLVKKPSVGTSPLPRPPNDKTIKVQSTSYIRKGNSLVRNPASRAATLGPRVFGPSINQSKGNVSNNISKITGSTEMTDSSVAPDPLMTGGRGTHVEMPKTPPLPCSGMTLDSENGYSGDCISSPPVDHFEGIDNEATKSSVTAPSSCGNLETDVNRSLEDPSTLSDRTFQASDLKRVVYIKHKSNQLIAASNPSKPSLRMMAMSPALSSDNGYYKRRKNQLVRASSESNIQQMVSKIDNVFNSQPQKALNVYSGRSSTKRQSNKAKPAKASLVWKLGDTKSSGKGVDPLRCGKILSHLLPWKRATYWRSCVWRSSANTSSNPSLMMTRKLLSSRKRASVYVRSGHGFSLRRSKVISLAGSSLKWSISMERGSKKVDEEAARAVAAMDSVEKPKTGASGKRIYRIGMFRYIMDPSRRTLQRVADEVSSDPTTSKPEHGASKTYVPKRLLIGSNEYVRIGNGNQLVRDPKRRTRLLASEKVRWSLHTARMRLAKKRKFCLFFTRFGKCNKGEGKCPYVHDPSKIAVCTKFLNGLCNDPSCKLTHKIIPERMPDCSFFLQGSCSNENCPYRHVNVNPKAPICESFLRGYCAEGNECQKKHSYICPEFEATGSCPQGSKCKLYHPNPKKGKGKERKTSKDQRHARGRYFGSAAATTSELETGMAEKLNAPKNGLEGSQGEMGDFIGIDDDDDDDDEPGENNDPAAEPMSLSEGEDIDDLIKPLRILHWH